MRTDDEQPIRIESEADIVTVRKRVREASKAIGFGVTDITRIVTAASELARNVFHYAGRGSMSLEKQARNTDVALVLTFTDEGPGIADVEQAMEPGFTTAGGLGLGLPGAKRLMDEMELETHSGKGTTIIIKKWKRA
jgi:serine/threonine-protein kinase RsbT